MSEQLDLFAERWRPVVGYEGFYEVSDRGRVRSVDRWVVDTRRGAGRKWCAGRFPTMDAKASGHLTVGLCVNGRRKYRLVHQLVLEAFVGPRPDGMCGLHWDDNPTNNHLSNLRYGTHSDNMQDMVRNGNHPMARKTHCKYGHEFTPENTYIRLTGGRRCMECERQRKRQLQKAA